MALRSLYAAIFAAAIVLQAPLHAEPAAELSGPDPELAGEPTSVLVLGTPHLAGMTEQIATSDLDLLLDRLEAFAPDLITIEAIPGQTCEILRLHSEIYPGVADSYCTDPAPALAALGLESAGASVALWETLAEWPNEPTSAERRRLAALFWATGDSWSATLQWLRLPPTQRLAADRVGDELKSLLDRRLASRNENFQIAAVLADRLGLDRLYPMDDHTADSVLIRTGPEIGPALQALWDEDIGQEAELEAEAEAMLGTPEGVLAHYRAINAPKFQAMVVDSDVGAAARRKQDDAITRKYVAWWQARQLRMTANVVEAAGVHPGARMLVLVGSSHKPYFDSYLSRMIDMELVDTADVLGEE